MLTFEVVSGSIQGTRPRRTTLAMLSIFWQTGSERGAVCLVRLHPDRAAMRQHRLTGDVQAQTEACPRTRIVDSYCRQLDKRMRSISSALV